MYYPLIYIVLFIGLLPLIGVIYKGKTFVFKEAILPFVWLTLIATLYEGIVTLIFQINTAYWSQIYSFLEILAVYYFYKRLFQNKYRGVFILFLIAMLFTYGISFLFWDENSKFLSKAINKVPLTFFVLGCSFIYFKKTLKQTSLVNPWQDPIYYFVVGFSIYYSSTFFLFLQSKHIFTSIYYSNDYWLINIIATLVLRFFLTIGVWKMR